MTTEQKILELHTTNPTMSLAEIGRIVGCSRENVRLHCDKNGITSHRIKKNIWVERANIIRPLFNKNVSRQEISEKTGFSEDIIKRIIHRDFEMKNTSFIMNKPFTFEQIKNVSYDWKDGMSIIALCRKHELCPDSTPHCRKSSIISSLRRKFGVLMFPTRFEKGNDDIVERYDELKAEGKTRKEIFQIVGGYRNVESMYQSVRNKRKEQNDS